MADFFELAVQAYDGEPKKVSNWILGELARLINLEKIEFGQVKVTPGALAQLLTLLDQKVINGKIAKMVFEEMFYTGKKPEAIVAEKDLEQVSDPKVIKEIVARTIAAHPLPVRDYLRGKKKALGFLVGQVMAETKGKANPEMVRDLLDEELSFLSRS